MVIRDDCVCFYQNVKDQCIFVAKGFITKLDKWFSAQNLMNPTCIIYPQYWLQPKVISMFPSHLKILKSHFYHVKIM
jgi:hypothetical protein